MADPNEPPHAKPAGLGSRRITRKQQLAYDARKAGKTWEEIAQYMGVSPAVVQGHVRKAERNGLPVIPRERYQRILSLSNAAAARRVTENLGVFGAKDGEFNLDAFTEAAQAAGVPVRMAMALGRRIQLNYGPVREEIKRLTLVERVEKTFGAADMILSYIDDASIAGMSAKDLAMAYGILVDKALVMGGRPNVIVDFNSRRRLEQLMPEFIAEAKRRGITVDGTATIVQEKILLPEEVNADPNRTQENS
ncbi:MAG: hypothetical protein U1E51_06835 [Candidatus Binatia bacterium]|nr:hypothetical protein [Candidatus Binatia bacterium]